MYRRAKAHPSLMRRKIKRWDSIHLAKWECEHKCDECGVHLAGFTYTRQVFRNELRHAGKDYSRLEVHRVCHGSGCSR